MAKRLSGRRHRPQDREQGFTLIELLTVVAIVGILAMIAIPVYMGYIDKARVTLAVGSLEHLRKTMESFSVDYQAYPTPPVDFMGTGMDADGRTLVDAALRGDLLKDVSSIDSYVLVGDQWTITARARDTNSTLITVTQTGITH